MLAPRPFGWFGDNFSIGFTSSFGFFGTRFSTDFTSSFDFFGRVCFLLDRMMRMMMTRIMTMRTTRREMRVRVDRALTVKDS